MENDWKEVNLDSFAKIIMGQSPKGETCNNSGVGMPLLNGPTEFGSSHPYPTQYTTDPKRESEIGDLLFCVRGSTTGRMNWSDKKYAIGRGIAAFRHKNGLEYAKFLRAVIEYNLPYLLASATGSTFPNVSGSQLKNLKVKLPPLPEQRAIAQVLGSLDDKIALLRRQNETLEAMAQALFKSWFVDFDPVLDKALAAGHAIPEPLQEKAARRKALGDRRKPLPEGVAKLFPDRFRFDEELGWVPEGWASGNVSDIGLNQRKSVKADSIDPNMAYIGLQDMPQKSISLENWQTSEEVSSNKYYFSKSDILFGKLRPYFHKVGIAPINGICSTDILVIKPKKAAYFSLLLSHLSSEEFIKFVTNSSTGTRMPRTNWKDMGSYSIVIPDKEILDFHTKIVKYKVEKIISNIWQTKYIKSLRDTLLPKLISGQIRLPEAEALINQQQL
jgi:type I restriction enzyme S subunit